MNFWQLYGEAAKTAAGFFWKAGWAFILGYFVSAMIQAFVPKKRLTPYMGDGDFKSISLATLFGAASSSCSFAALAAARSLVMKGAHFIAAVAFMFASTNLVIELGILILIFLGWQFLAAELVGGLVLIAISSLIIKMTYPQQWIDAAREHLDEQEGEEEDFNWRERIKSRKGWNLVGHKFVMDWQMVWEEILIGFTIAGFVAVFVPPWLWEKIFLQGYENVLPAWLIAVENAVVAPFVAGLTFIGSMGNIPLATVLNANGVLFAGIMGFIYSDLMVPPLVMINAKYYGWRMALYIAGVMFVSIVATALLLHILFSLLGITPESAKAVEEAAQFKFDYTFYMNIFFVLLAGVLARLHHNHKKEMSAEMDHDMGGGIDAKRVGALVFLCVLLVGIAAFFITGGK
ncbi:MAG: permease [Desulfobulbaceae bacterium]|nr:permease [Desulfobulbaceae bacterium]